MSAGEMGAAEYPAKAFVQPWGRELPGGGNTERLLKEQ